MQDCAQTVCGWNVNEYNPVAGLSLANDSSLQWHLQRPVRDDGWPVGHPISRSLNLWLHLSNFYFTLMKTSFPRYVVLMRAVVACGMFRTFTDTDQHCTRLPEHRADLNWSPYRNTVCSWTSVPIAKCFMAHLRGSSSVLGHVQGWWNK
jgi:hypothetical protein